MHGLSLNITVNTVLQFYSSISETVRRITNNSSFFVLVRVILVCPTKNTLSFNFCGFVIFHCSFLVPVQLWYFKISLLVLSAAAEVKLHPFVCAADRFDLSSRCHNKKYGVFLFFL